MLLSADLLVAEAADVLERIADRDVFDRTAAEPDAMPDRVEVPAERVAVEAPLWVPMSFLDRIMEELLRPADKLVEPMPFLPEDPVVDSLDV